ncbi:MAG: DUF3108 domain-containing protein [Alphaproteobacteria bacterium]|nr:DUF3108 domain-containing protein [Alphaproteobacteria bacterium]
MSFRTVLIGFALCCGATTTTLTAAAAQDARQVEIGYEITYLGMAGFRIDLTARFEGTRYDIETSTFKNGVLKALTMNYAGRNRAWGVLTAAGARPTAGSLSIVVDDKTRTWSAQYGADGSLKETHNPEWKPLPKQAIPERDRVGSLDPLSAAVTAGLAGDAACDRTLPTNDGKRRIDVMLRKVRSEPAAASGIAGAQGDVLVCEISTRRVSGEFYDGPKESEAERERPVRIWFARLDNTPVRYPAKLEAELALGTARGKTLWFRERPMSAEEAQAMRR